MTATGTETPVVSFFVLFSLSHRTGTRHRIFFTFTTCGVPPSLHTLPHIPLGFHFYSLRLALGCMRPVSCSALFCRFVQSLSSLVSGLQANAATRADRQAEAAGEAWSRSISAARSLGPEVRLIIRCTDGIVWYLICSVTLVLSFLISGDA